MTKEELDLIEKAGLLVVGWFLGLLTTAAQKRRRVSTLKKALEAEIADAKRWLLLTKLHLEQMLQLCAVGEIASQGPVKIPVPIFATNFAEATLKLNEGERGSFNAIYTRIGLVNEHHDKLMELNRIVADDVTRMGELAGELELYYTNVWTAIHLIEFHLRNGKNLNKVFNSDPELGLEYYQRIQKQIGDRLMGLANEARDLGPDKLRQRHASGGTALTHE